MTSLSVVFALFKNMDATLCWLLDYEITLSWH